MSSILFINGKVWQPDGSFTEAFGVNNGHFDFSGSNTEAKSLSENYSQTIDLNGKLVLPGLIDGHLHLVKGSQMLKLLDCSMVNSRDELKAAINKYSAKNKLKWIIGSNLDINKVFGDYDITNGNIIDEIFDKLPLYITNYDYHSAICNTKAIKETGLDSAIVNYSKNEVEISGNGELTGILRERSLEFIVSGLPELSII